MLYYLVKFPPKVLCIFQEHPENPFIVRFHSQVHGKVFERPNNYITVDEAGKKDTSLAHLKDCIIAASEDYDQLLGAAVIEVL